MDYAFAQVDLSKRIFEELSQNALEIKEYKSAEIDEDIYKIRVMSWGTSAEHYFERLAEDRKATWFRLAKEGNPSACFLVGRCYNLGVGFTEDQDKAHHFLTKSVEQGHVWAMVYLARTCLAQGDKESALTWYRKAAESGDPYAQQVFFKVLQKGSAGLTDNEEASKWIEKAVETNNPLALTVYAELFFLAPFEGFEPSPEKCVQLLKKAAGQGSASAMNLLGGLYEEGVGVPKSLDSAVQWYTKAVELNHIGAMTNLGLMHELGIGLTENTREAFRLYKLAAESGDPAAMVNIGSCYRFGRGVNKEPGLAFSWTRKAAEKGNSIGLYQYAVLLLNGVDGVAGKNEELGFQQLKKSFEANPQEVGVIELLVECYTKGIGTAVDRGEATRLKRLLR